MPISLPPLSRRAFLGSAAASAAGLALGCRASGPVTPVREVAASAPASSAPAGPMLSRPGRSRVLVLSDTHINADASATSRDGTVNMADRLAAVIDDALPAADRYAFAVINGDASHIDGQPGDYTQLIELLRPLREAGVPVHITLGNHDDRHAFRRAFDAPLSELAFKHVLKVPAGGTDFYLLDSLRVVNETPGALGEDQIAWLERELSGSPRPAVLVVHHPPVPDAGEKPFGLQDFEAFYEVVAPRAQVMAVMHGHSHRWRLHSHDRVALVGLPPTAYTFEPAAPWGYVVCDLAPEGLIGPGLDVRLRAMDGHALDGSVGKLRPRRKYVEAVRKSPPVTA